MNEKDYAVLRNGAEAFYQLIEDTTQNSPERVQALINVEQALMWANTALSRYKATGDRREELFLNRNDQREANRRQFTLNPLAKVEPEDPCNASCGAILKGGKCPNCGRSQER